MKKTHVALLVWFFTAAIGGHKVYLEDKIHYLFWYWIVSAMTLGIVPFTAVFTLSSQVRIRNVEIQKFGW